MGKRKICIFYYALHILLIRIFSLTPCIFKKLQDANKMKLFIEIFKSPYTSYIKISIKSSSLEGRFPLTFKKRLRKEGVLAERRSERKWIPDEVTWRGMAVG